MSDEKIQVGETRFDKMAMVMITSVAIWVAITAYFQK